MRAGVVLASLVAVGCGEVAGDKKPDARTPDMAVSMVDAPVDTPVAVTKSSVFAKGVASFAAPSATFTKVPYNTEVHDDESEYDATTHRFTAKQAGDYLVCAALTLYSDTNFELDVYKNSARLRATSYGKRATNGCTVVRLAAADYIEIWMWQQSGTTVNVTTHNEFDTLTIHRLQSSVLAQTSAAMSVPNTTFTRIPYDTETFDDSNAFDTTNHRFTAAQATDALVCASMALGSMAYTAEVDIYKNGARENALAYGTGTLGSCRTVRLAATETVEVWMHHSLGSTISVPHDVSWNWITVHSQPASVSLDNITTFNYAAGAFTKVLYTSEDYDAGGEFDIGTSTFTADAAGDYFVCASFDTTLGSAYFLELDAFKNGNRYSGIAWGYSAATGCGVVRLAADDQLDVRIYQDSGSTRASVPNGIWNWLQITKVR